MYWCSGEGSSIYLRESVYQLYFSLQNDVGSLPLSSIAPSRIRVGIRDGINQNRQEMSAVSSFIVTICTVHAKLEAAKPSDGDCTAGVADSPALVKLKLVVEQGNESLKPLSKESVVVYISICSSNI